MSESIEQKAKHLEKKLGEFKSKIHIKNLTLSLGELINEIRSGNILINDVKVYWDKEQKDYFLLNVLLGLCNSVIKVEEVHKDLGIWRLLYGYEGLLTLKEFIEDEITININQDFLGVNGLKYSQLTPIVRLDIKRRPVDVTVIKF